MQRVGSSSLLIMILTCPGSAVTLRRHVPLEVGAPLGNARATVVRSSSSTRSRPRWDAPDFSRVGMGAGSTQAECAGKRLGLCKSTGLRSPELGMAAQADEEA